MNLLPSPNKQREISIMLELGFMIDNYLTKRVCNLSSDPYVDQQLLKHLSAISKLTLDRGGMLSREDGCF